MKHVRKYRLVPINQSTTEETTQIGGESTLENTEKTTVPSEEIVKTPTEEKPVEKIEEVKRLPPPGIPEESISKSEAKQWQTGRGRDVKNPRDSLGGKNTRVTKAKATKPQKKKSIKKKPKWISL